MSRTNEAKKKKKTHRFYRIYNTLSDSVILQFGTTVWSGPNNYILPGQFYNYAHTFMKLNLHVQ
jgi:hypothetical protein